MMMILSLIKCLIIYNVYSWHNEYNYKYIPNDSLGPDNDKKYEINCICGDDDDDDE